MVPFQKSGDLHHFYVEGAFSHEKQIHSSWIRICEVFYKKNLKLDYTHSHARTHNFLGLKSAHIQIFPLRACYFMTEVARYKWYV